MHPATWRAMAPLYLVFVLAFPLGMYWVESRPMRGPTVCLFRQVTHLDCPSCGLTRAFRAMGRLDVVAATRYNPLGPAIFLGAIVYWGYAVGMLATRGRLRLPEWWVKRQPRMFSWGIAIFLLVGFARMLYELRYPPPPPMSPPITFRLPGP